MSHDFITFRFILFSRCWVRRGDIMLWCRGINPQTFNDFISSPVSLRGLRHLPLLCSVAECFRLATALAYFLWELWLRAPQACSSVPPPATSLCAHLNLLNLWFPSRQFIYYLSFHHLPPFRPSPLVSKRLCLYCLKKSLSVIITLLLLSCWLILPEIISLLAFWV